MTYHGHRIETEEGVPLDEGRTAPEPRETAGRTMPAVGPSAAGRGVGGALPGAGGAG